MDSFIFRHHLGTLKPVDQAGFDALMKFKNDEQLQVIFKRARNPRHHRLYWALMALIHPQQDTYTTIEQLSNAVKCAVGWCDKVELTSGMIMAIPRSISFANMKQDEFDQFFEKVVQLVITKILPGVDREDLRNRLDDMIGS